MRAPDLDGSRRGRYTPPMLLALLACVSSSQTDTGVSCDSGFTAHDGACYEVADTGDTAADTDTGDSSDPDTDTGPADADGDGYGVGTDCDDTSAAIHPGAAEVCNGLDDNCDGAVDEGVEPNDWYTDTDGDGYGAGAPVYACEAPDGMVMSNDDCDDVDPDAYPGAADDQGDGVDNDCDGTVDEDWNPCATRYGRLDFPTITTATAGYTNNMGTIQGTGYVCGVSCDRGWLTVYLSPSEACGSVESWPVLNNSDMRVCAVVDSGARDSATCEFDTSDGLRTMVIDR